MTPQELRDLPVGTVVVHKDSGGLVADEQGEIMRSGRDVEVYWFDLGSTRIMDTEFKGWHYIIEEMEVVREEA